MRHTSKAALAAILGVLSWAGASAAQRGGGPGPGSSMQPPVPIGLIVGRVVDAVTGQPVPEAEVSIVMRAPAPPGRSGANPFAAGPTPANVRLLTGADGRFVIRDLPAGNVQLSTRAAGYVPGSHGQSRPNGAPLPVVVSAENRVIAATIRMWRHASITGIITDERNDPAVNIQVRAMQRTFRQGQPRFTMAASGRTDDRGMYRISGLTPGDYIVVVPQVPTTIPAAALDALIQAGLTGQVSAGMPMEVAASLGAGGGPGVRVGDNYVNLQSGATAIVRGDGRMAAYLTQYHPAATASWDAMVVSLAAGEERSSVDIRMPLVATSSVTGTVLGPEGPLANATIRLVNPVEPEGDQLNDVARAVSAANGAFQLLGVPPGQYVLKAIRQGREPLPPALASNPQLAAISGMTGMMGGMGRPVSPGEALTLSAETPVAIDQQDVANLVLTLSPGAVVSGHLEFVGNAPPPAPATFNVLLVPFGGTASRGTPVGEDGRFATAGSPAGKYLISTSARTDGPGWLVKSAMVNGVDALDQPFELGSENIGNVVVTFTDRRSSISGTVIDASNAPVQATVIVFPASYREWIARGMSTRLTRSGRSGPKGAFALAAMPPRDYLILAVRDEQVPDLQNPAVFDALARSATSLTLVEGETRTVSLKLTAVVR